METLLLIAAESWEFTGLLRHLPPPVDLKWPVEYSCEFDLGVRRWVALANGPGPRLAAAAMDAALGRTSVTRVISAGFCGALDPAISAGQVFVADRVLSTDTGESFDALQPTGPVRVASGAMVSGDRVVLTVEQKRQLRQTTAAAAVDMESAAVAAAARRSRLPFYCLRAVTDTAAEGFATDFNALRDADGRFSRTRIALAAMRKPYLVVPELFRLRRRGREAADALGDFLATVRF